MVIAQRSGMVMLSMHVHPLWFRPVCHRVSRWRDADGDASARGVHKIFRISGDGNQSSVKANKL